MVTLFPLTFIQFSSVYQPGPELLKKTGSTGNKEENYNDFDVLEAQQQINFPSLLIKAAQLKWHPCLIIIIKKEIQVH